MVGEKYQSKKLAVFFSFLFGVCLLAACSSPPPAPIHSRKPPPSERIDYHIVSQGETLFALAWRFEKDVQKLAAANGLAPPYRLKAGQRLTLDTSRVKRVVYRPREAEKTAEPAKPVVRKPSVTKDRATKEALTKSTATKQKPPAPSRQPTQQSSQQPKALPAGKWHWQRPVPGAVTRQYNRSDLFKGIDFRVQPGQSITAAAPGEVVYAGSGLRGYGKLIIIKHSDVFLSAYGHNRKIIVSEGQTVKAGQKISEAGGDPANPRRLYFEIRRDGKPVNPLHYLPKA